MKYKIIVDYGKPFEIISPDKECLFNELLKLDNEQAQTDIPFLDISIFNNKGLDITDEIFKQYNFKKEKVGFLK